MQGPVQRSKERRLPAHIWHWRTPEPSARGADWHNQKSVFLPDGRAQTQHREKEGGEGAHNTTQGKGGAEKGHTTQERGRGSQTAGGEGPAEGPCTWMYSSSTSQKNSLPLRLQNQEIQDPTCGRGGARRRRVAAGGRAAGTRARGESAGRERALQLSLIAVLGASTGAAAVC